MPIHPYIQHLIEKDEHTIEEAAIIGYARIINQGGANEHVVANFNRWLRELNPHHLSGQALIEWAHTITQETLNGGEAST